MTSQKQVMAAGVMAVPATQPGPGTALAMRGWGRASFWSLRRDLTVFTRQPALSSPRYGARPQVSGLGGTCVLNHFSRV